MWLKAAGDATASSTSRTTTRPRAPYRGDYFTLGDMGYLDEDGFLFLTDRSANLIISGGVNIYPAEIDAVLLEHPAVGDAATIGVPDDEWGEQVLAVVELQPGVAPTAELADELLEHLPRAAGPLQVPAVGRLRRAPAPPGQRQGLQAPAARPVPSRRCVAGRSRCCSSSSCLLAGGAAGAAGGATSSSTSTTIEVDQRIIPRPNSGVAPKDIGDRGGAAQMALDGCDIRRRRADRVARGPRVPPGPRQSVAALADVGLSHRRSPCSRRSPGGSRS